MRRAIRRALVAVACVAVVGVAGCGGSGDGDEGGGADTTAASMATTGAASAEGRPVTDEQALVLARLLQQNWQHGGATFTGTVPVQGTEVRLRGRVDFRSGRGDATLRDPSGQTRRYVWTRRAVHAQEAPGASRFVVQAPDPEGDPVHAAIAFLNLLSAETIDNTANIKDQDARFLRSERLGASTVDVYRYGANGRTTYWVGRDDGLLRQAQAVFPDAGRLTVRLTAHQPVRVRLPRG